jgi:hypothetical protein
VRSLHARTVGFDGTIDFFELGWKLIPSKRFGAIRRQY